MGLIGPFLSGPAGGSGPVRFGKAWPDSEKPGQIWKSLARLDK